MKNFGEFYNNQVETAGTIVLSRTDSISEAKLHTCLQLLQEKNPKAVIVTTPWERLNGAQILEAMEFGNTLMRELEEAHDHDHEHHHHHDHDEHCDCHDHEHHHHEHEHEHEHDHHHHHEHDEHCTCGCHDHDHHHADEVFTSWGVETAKKFTEEEIHAALAGFDAQKYGTVLRAKGIVAAVDGGWIHFDYVPEEHDVRRGSAAVTGRLCVIGAEIPEAALAELFGV